MCGGLAAWMVGPPLSLSVCLVVLGPIGVPSAALLPLLAGRAAEEGRKEGRKGRKYSAEVYFGQQVTREKRFFVPSDCLLRGGALTSPHFPRCMCRGTQNGSSPVFLPDVPPQTSGLR